MLNMKINTSERPNSIIFAVQLLIVNTVFAAILLFNQHEGLLEPFGEWSALLLSLLLCAFWFCLTWFIYMGHSWAKAVVIVLIMISVGYTALGVMNNPSGVLPVEFLQTASDLLVFALLSSPSSIEWLRNNS